MTLDPSRPRDAIVEAGRRRLLSHAIDGLRSQLNASVLSGESPVSRDTAYRVFRDDRIGEGVTDAIIAAVTDAVNEWTWAGYEAALGEAMEAYQAGLNSGDDTATNVVAALQAAFEAQFRSRGVPAGWSLQAAALTASPVWKGDPPAPNAVEVAETVLRARRAGYEALTDRLLGIAQVAMSELGRRPRAGVDVRSVVVLTHALLDGATLRRLIDADALSPKLVAESMYLLWMAFSEPGPYDDPRRPDDDSSRRAFDRLLEDAATLWRRHAGISVVDVAERAAVPEAVATHLFPTVGDLADSLLRARVAGGGLPDPAPRPGETEARQRVLVLVTELQRLRHLADTVPHAVASARAQRPTRSTPFVDEFVDNESRAIEALGLASNARALVEDLVRFAAQGTPGWDSVTALLRTIGYRHDQAP